MSISERKQRQFDSRESAIMDAALQLCSSSNWESITVDQIAAKAQIGKGTVYKHFSSKDELLFRLMIQFYTGLLAELRTITPKGNATEQFRHIIYHSFQYHLKHVQYRYIVLYCERVDFKEQADAEWRKDFLRLDQAFEDWGTPLIISGIQRGEFRDRPVPDVLVGMYAAFRGGVTTIWTDSSWCSTDHSAEEMIHCLTDFMVSGLIGSE